MRSRMFGDGGIDSVKVELADGADATAFRPRSTPPLPQVPTAEVVDHATVLAETTDDFTQEINVVGNICSASASSLFVSIFIIYNTFSIVLGQRTRAGAAAHDRRRPQADPSLRHR